MSIVSLQEKQQHVVSHFQKNKSRIGFHIIV